MLKCFLVLTLLCFNVFLLSACHTPPAVYEEKIIKINDHVFTVEIADTATKQTQGLSGRASLQADHGMLFIFDSAEKRTFWMKDMLIPIDIIWLNNGVITAIDKNCPVPQNYKIPTFSPNIYSDKVLELNAGTADKYNFQVGDKLELLSE